MAQLWLSYGIITSTKVPGIYHPSLAVKIPVIYKKVMYILELYRNVTIMALPPLEEGAI